MNYNAYNLISQLLKTADMPVMPGMGQVKNRNLKWVRFDRNTLTQHLSKLPDPVKAALSNKLGEFNAEFKKFPAGQKSKFTGMLWVLYADDRSITDDFLRKLKSSGGELGNRLFETAKFAQKNALQLPKNESLGTTRGKTVDKSIGSDYWLSMFGYAYQGLPGYNVLRRENDIPRKVFPNPGNRQYDKPNGPLAIAQHGDGFRLVIETPSGEVPAYIGQSVQNFAKYFKGQKLYVNKSVVYIPPAGVSDIVPSHLAGTTEPDIENGPLLQISNEQASYLIKENEEQRKFIWGVFVDKDGVFYIQQRSTFGGGRGGTKLSGEKKPMSFEQLKSIVNPDRIGVNHVIFPGQSSFSEDELTDNDIVTGTKYVYEMDEGTKDKIRNPDMNNQLEWAVSSLALNKLRTFIEVSSDDEDVHTSFEGFLLYMVGPVFRKSTNLGQGKALGRPLTTDPKFVSTEEPNTPSGELIVDRDVHWVVLANRISEQRRLLNDRDTYLDLWQKIHETDDLQEALDFMVQRASSNGGSIPRISSKAESVGQAQKALEQAKTMPSDKFFQPKKIQPTERVPQLPSSNNQIPDEIDMNKDMNSLASSLIRRLKNNV